MTQEDKEILLKDLCARLSYSLKCSIYRVDDFGVGWRDAILNGFVLNDYGYEFYFDDYVYVDSINKVKPYLFPMSSMTEEQKNYIRNRFCYDWDGEPYEIWRHKIDIEDADSLVDWFNENHFDYRGLIPKNLAIDATGLNVY